MVCCKTLEILLEASKAYSIVWVKVYLEYLDTGISTDVILRPTDTVTAVCSVARAPASFASFVSAPVTLVLVFVMAAVCS